MDAGFLLTVVNHAAFLHGLVRQGSPGQKGKWMPKLLKGMLTATAIAEPHSGTDASGSQSIARESDGHWLLNGSKWNISHANTAGLYAVLGKMDGLGPTLFLLEANAKGITVGEPQSKLGNRSLPTASIHFEDCAISEENIIGKAGRGMQALGEFVTLARIWDGWMGAMLICPLIDKAMAWLEERHSFGQPLLEHQHVQSKIAEALLALQQARWVGRGALRQMLANAPDKAMMSSIAKLCGSRAALGAALDLLSLMGSEGYLEGPFERLTRDAIGLMMVGGTEEMHKINIFNQFKKLSK
jgi:alkylation response protein AidB-like acyl-CoA dehydrogenase